MHDNSNEISIDVREMSAESQYQLPHWRDNVAEQAAYGSDRSSLAQRKASSSVGTWARVMREPFRNHSLDRKLKRHHITGNTHLHLPASKLTVGESGIAFSAAVGIGLFDSSGEVLAMGGPVGALIAFFLASLVIIAVMRCLAGMVSVRPVEGALMNFPAVFVEPALGVAVGVTYWYFHKACAFWGLSTAHLFSRLANCVSMITLTTAAAIYTQYWHDSIPISWATFLLLVGILFLNACKVQVRRASPFSFKMLIREVESFTGVLRMCLNGSRYP